MMPPSIKPLAAAALLALAATSPLRAQTPARPDPAAVIAAQRDALASLAFLDGVWRGPAWTMSATGEKHAITQTERVGPFLDGSIRVIEGRGYEADGRPGFNAFAVISFDLGERVYRFHSHAQGHVGDFVLTPSADGFAWSIPAGPKTTIRYTATVKNGEWFEVGDRLVADQAPVRFFEMRLQRVGDTTWPAGGAVPPK